MMSEILPLKLVNGLESLPGDELLREILDYNKNNVGGNNEQKI